MPNTPDIDVSALAEALNEKLDRDGGNATNAIKEMMVHMGMPSDRYIDLTLPASGDTVTAPDDGWIYLNMILQQYGAIALVVYDNGALRYSDGAQAASNNAGASVIIPVIRGTVVTVLRSNGTVQRFSFIYANGTQHLAS